MQLKSITELIYDVLKELDVKDNLAQYWLSVTTIEGHLSGLVSTYKVTYDITDHRVYWKLNRFGQRFRGTGKLSIGVTTQLYRGIQNLYLYCAHLRIKTTRSSVIRQREGAILWKSEPRGPAKKSSYLIHKTITPSTR